MQATETIQAPPGVASSAVDGRGRIAIGDFLLVAVQLLLVLVLLRQFQIEGKAFVELAAFTFAGFVVHAFLPLAWRMPFFALLSVASIAFVLGFENAAWIVAIGAVLVGICHLPIAVRWRTVLLLTAAGVLVAQRSALLPIPGRRRSGRSSARCSCSGSSSTSTTFGTTRRQ